MTRLFHALGEAGVMLVVAAVLGFIYTASTGKGIFAPPPAAPPAIPKGLTTPVMITREQAQSYFESGSAVFIDARHEFDYKLGHIKGAVSVPLRMFEKRMALLDTIPKNRLLIAYCDGAECNSSIELSVDLAKAGFTEVKIFFGGWREWTAANLPIEKTP